MPIDDASTSLFSYESWVCSTQPIDQLKRSCWLRIDGVPADKCSVGQSLARLGLLQPQYGGMTCWDVVPKSPGEGTSIGNKAIDFHTELAEFPAPPRYVALYCLRPAHSGGALRLLDLEPLLNSLRPSLTEALLHDLVTVCCEEAIAEEHGSRRFSAPTLSWRAEGLMVRYDPLSIDGNMPDALRELVDLIREYAAEHAFAFVQPAGSLVIWDNWRVVHGRTAFDGGERHLWRFCISADQVTT